MKRILALLIFVFAFSAPSFAAAKDEKCVSCVTAKQRAIVQKKLDDLRARVKELEAENRFLKEESGRPIVAATPRAAQEKVEVVEVKKMKRNIISGIAGYGPQSATIRRKESLGGEEIAIKSDVVVGGMYQHVFADTIAIGGGLTVPTKPDTKLNTYFGSIGVAF